MLNYEELEKKVKEYINNHFVYLNFIYSNQPNNEEYHKKSGMIIQKYNHTMRVVKQMVLLSNKLHINLNFEAIIKAVGLLHDIGRFDQATDFGSFVDSKCFPGGINHGEIGYNFLNNNGFDNFDVEAKYRKVIGIPVRYHQNNNVPEEYCEKLNDEFFTINPEIYLTKSSSLNEMERKIVVLLLQMVRDVDKIDILYQRAIGEIPSFKDLVKVNNIGLSNLCKQWGVSENIIKGNNSISAIDNDREIYIPIENIPIEKLMIDNDLKRRIYNKENIQLKDLQRQDNYTFITSLWWSIYTFLKDINFVANLELVNESRVLEDIYSQYPIKYRILIDEIFAYAKDYLIEETLKNNKNGLYLVH